MAYDQATLTAMRILDCPLKRHQVPDTLGDHLSKIKESVSALSSETASIAAINDLRDEIEAIAAQQQANATMIKFIYDALVRLTGGDHTVFNGDSQ